MHTPTLAEASWASAPGRACACRPQGRLQPALVMVRTDGLLFRTSPEYTPHLHPDRLCGVSGRRNGAPTCSAQAGKAQVKKLSDLAPYTKGQKLCCGRNTCETCSPRCGSTAELGFNQNIREHSPPSATPLCHQVLVQNRGRAPVQVPLGGRLRGLRARERAGGVRGVWSLRLQSQRTPSRAELLARFTSFSQPGPMRPLHLHHGRRSAARTTASNARHPKKREEEVKPEASLRKRLRWCWRCCNLG